MDGSHDFSAEDQYDVSLRWNCRGYASGYYAGKLVYAGSLSVYQLTA